MIDFQNKNPRILVIGDLMIDHYLWGSCERISPEAPVQIVNVNNESIVLGGAGNVINNLNVMGAYVDVIGVIGKCNASKELKNLLNKIDVNTKYLITQEDRTTSKKSRIIASNQQVIRYDLGSTEEINEKTENSVLNLFTKIIKSYDVVLLSDYGKGLFTFRLTQSLISVANKHKKKLLIDPKGHDFAKYKGAYLLTPNKKEASQAINYEINNNETLERAIQDLKKQCSLEVSLITLSEHGVAIFDKSLRIHPTAAIEVFDVTGAGDTILASLGFALSSDMSIDESVKFANLAAGVVVGKIGSATASIQEIIAYESSLNITNSYQQIKTWDEISYITNNLKNKDKRIVFTNGCFDILHFGHVKYLEKAKSFGDILVVGINSDSSVKKIKGQNRPINTQNDRAYLLASIKVIDYVVIFDEKTPLDLIKLIKPDILVKGGDYKGKKVIGEENVKELKIVDYIDDRSTTKTIEKIKRYEANY